MPSISSTILSLSGGRMSDARKQLRYFLASRGQTPEQIAQTENDLMMVVNVGASTSFGMATRRLMNVLVLSDDSVTDLGAVHASAQFTAAMQELLDASKRTTQIDMELMKNGIQQLADDNAERHP